MHNYAFSFKFKRNSRDRIISIITRAKGSWWRRRNGILSWVVIGFKEQEDRCRISQGWRDSPVHSMLLTVCDEREFYDHINHRVHGVTLSILRTDHIQKIILMTADNPHFPICTKAELLFSPGRDVSIPKAVPLTKEERSLWWVLMDSGVFIFALKEI